MTTTTTTTTTTIREIILSLRPDLISEALTDDARLFALGLDSTNALELIAELQRAFAVEFTSEQLYFEHFESIASIRALLESIAPAGPINAVAAIGDDQGRGAERV